MDDLLRGIVNWIFSVITFSVDNSNVTSSLSDFSPALNDYAVSIMDTVMKPIGYVILSLFLLLELQKISLKVESTGGNGQLGFELVMKTLIKMALCKFAMDSLSLIMSAITEVSLYMTNQIQALNIETIDTSGLYDSQTILDPIMDEGFWVKLGIFLILFFVLIITIGSVVMVQVVVNMRFIEMYIFLAVAPIPIATIPHDEWSSVAKNFFKSFAGIALQGTLIYLVMTFYPYILKSAFQSISGTTDGMEMMLKIVVGLLGNSILLVFAIMATGRWSKSITNAM
ncbi:hypothetical protein [Enterococcus casseliflavus]|uniref:hypothetical protein n=1 Tax=Enterococcus casseliflavus TaxID=37734 RepID=UPI0035E316BD